MYRQMNDHACDGIDCQSMLGMRGNLSSAQSIPRDDRFLVLKHINKSPCKITWWQSCGRQLLQLPISPGTISIHVKPSYAQHNRAHQVGAVWSQLHSQGVEIQMLRRHDPHSAVVVQMFDSDSMGPQLLGEVGDRTNGGLVGSKGSTDHRPPAVALVELAIPYCGSTNWDMALPLQAGTPHCFSSMGQMLPPICHFLPKTIPLEVESFHELAPSLFQLWQFVGPINKGFVEPLEMCITVGFNLVRATKTEKPDCARSRERTPQGSRSSSWGSRGPGQRL